MDVMQRITEIIHDFFFDDDTIVASEGLSAVDVPDWDSLNHIRLMVTIENEFGIRLGNSRNYEFAEYWCFS